MFPIHRLNSPISRSQVEAMTERISPLDAEVLGTVRSIIDDVRERGDEALIEMAARFDRADISKAGIRVSEEEIEAACEAVDEDFLSAIEEAADRIESYHRSELHASWHRDEGGILSGERVTPVECAGIYAPGGNARYPSTVIMGVIAARVAEVDRVIVATPPRPDGSIDPHVLCAAAVAGADDVYRLGGAGAIAAMAFGTQTVTKVDIIAGPGNVFVTAAKKEVFGIVGIDGLAGPSEVVVIADESAPADLVAADLLAQVEHGSGATAFLVTWSESIAGEVARAVADLLKEAAAASLDAERVKAQVRCLIAEDRESALQVASHIAAEHVELIIEEPFAAVDSIRHAGAILIGPYTPAALSDYAAGPNHILPTGGSARFASPLSAATFMTTTSILRCEAEAAAGLAPIAATIASAEGLHMHALAALLRGGDSADEPRDAAEDEVDAE